MVTRPVQTDHDDADREAVELGCEIDERFDELTVADPADGLGDPEVHDEQGRGDGENGIREERDPLDLRAVVLAVIGDSGLAVLNHGRTVARHLDLRRSVRLASSVG
jgi:hypothetical protein